MAEATIKTIWRLIRSFFANSLYRRSLFFILLIVMLFAAWRISAKIAWKNTLVQRAEYISRHEKQKYEFEKNYGATLNIKQVLSDDSYSPNIAYDLIFYFFIPPDIEFAKSENFLEGQKLLEYLLDKMGLSTEKYIVLVCADASLVSRLDFLVTEMHFKFIKPVPVKKEVYQQLSLSEDGYALIITKRNSQIVWCSLPPPRETTYAKLIAKLL